jgi:hypothetical protein
MNKIIKSSDNIKLRGEYTVYHAIVKTLKQRELLKIIENKRKEGLEFFELVKQFNVLCNATKYSFLNIVPIVGRTLIANNLTSASPTNTMLINYIAIGTGSTAVDNADTQLATEVYRNTTASKTNALNVAYISAFFSATETTGTYKEAGIFSNATATANSGVLVSRVLLNPTTGITKSGTETLTIDWSLSLS